MEDTVQLLDFSVVLDTCIDEENFELLINKVKDRWVPCSWIDDAYKVEDVEIRREAQCSKWTVKNSCPRACGSCCGDNPSHKFFVKDENMISVKVSCGWLAKDTSRRERYCPQKKLSCPSSCGFCNAGNEGGDEMGKAPELGGASSSKSSASTERFNATTWSITFLLVLTIWLL